MYRKLRLIALSLIVSCFTLILTGCGGGGGGGQAAIIIYPQFDIYAYANGVRVPGFDVQPGMSQTMYMPVNQTFELNSNSSVSWDIYVNGVIVPPQNHNVYVGSLTIQELLTTNYRFVANAYSPYYLTEPVQITVYVTSLVDPSQYARINIILTN